MKKSFSKMLIIDIVMIALALVSVLMLFIEVLGNITQNQLVFFQEIDIFIAFVFLLEFIFHFVRAPDKKHFLAHRWWELLSAIPITSTTTQALRSIKLVRILPFIEGLRFIRVAVRLKMILESSKRFTKQTYLIYLATIVSIIVFSGAYAFYRFEFGINPHVHSFWDSIYWAIITIATVGYGDISPITPGGRVVAIILIFSGMAAIGSMIAAIETYVIKAQKLSK